MSTIKEYIWYASYGSNLLEDRFNCYIHGGKPSGSTKIYKGCRDKNLPIKKEETYISSELYFAKKSKLWNNGEYVLLVTFLETKKKLLEEFI